MVRDSESRDPCPVSVEEEVEEVVNPPLKACATATPACFSSSVDSKES